MVIYEGGAAVTQARSLWRIELVRVKWHGALVGFEQVFRIRHITTGRYLGVVDGMGEKLVQLIHKDRASYYATAFVMCSNKDQKKQLLDEKEEEGMGVATIRYGETNAFIRHVEKDVWLTYQTNEVTKKGLGKGYGNFYYVLQFNFDQQKRFFQEKWKRRRQSLTARVTWTTAIHSLWHWKRRVNLLGLSASAHPF